MDLLVRVLSGASCGTLGAAIVVIAKLWPHGLTVDQVIRYWI